MVRERGELNKILPSPNTSTTKPICIK